MTTHTLSLALAGALLLTACSKDDPQSPQTPGTIQLTAAQATVIKSRVAALAPVHPELAWLADTISLVAGNGSEAQQVSVTTSTGTGPFYAVSLQRTIKTATSASAAFDIIMFNDPSNPTDFMIVSGWTNPGNNTTSPESVTGTFGAPTATSTVNASFFHVDGSTVSAWRATSGTASFNTGTSSGTCQTVTNSATVTCQLSAVHATFNVSASQRDSGTSADAWAASLSGTDVSGIIIKMLIQ